MAWVECQTCKGKKAKEKAKCPAKCRKGIVVTRTL